MMDALSKAVAERDPGLARQVLSMDDHVDALYEEVSRELITYMMEDPRTITKALTLMRVARSYERLGDHLENIAERVIYWLTGRCTRPRRTSIDGTHPRGEGGPEAAPSSKRPQGEEASWPRWRRGPSPIAPSS